MSGVLGGENRVVEEVCREEIMVSDQSKPGLRDAPESEEGFWRQPRQYFPKNVWR